MDQELLDKLVDDVTDLQHTTTKHAILNYLLSNGYTSVDGNIYKDIVRMNKNGKVVCEVQY